MISFSVVLYFGTTKLNPSLTRQEKVTIMKVKEILGL